jgi:site-specific recombinase XerD
MKENKSYLKAYEEFMRIENFSPSTIKSYLLGLRQFLEFRELHKINEPIDQEQARQFILHKYDQGAKWQTINNVYSGLRKYFKEVANLDWTTKKIKRPRRGYVLPVLINLDEVKQIVENCKMFKYQVFITLMYSTGMRLSECLNLEIEHIDGTRKELLVRKGKGNKDRYIHLPEKVLKLLRVYYQIERPEKYLFNGRYKSSRLSARSAQRAIKQAVKRAKILKQVSSHTFRNCYATHHLEGGTNIVYLQEQMGHKHLKTTAKYIKLSQTYHQQIVHPIERLQINYLKGVKA